MKISCDIIRDVLPLYAEDMVSTATREMVDEHLCECEGCTKELESLKTENKLPVEADVTSLKRIGDSIRRRRILAVMAVFLFIATVLLGGALMLDAKIYLTVEQAIESVEALEDGTLRVGLSSIVAMTGSVGSGNSDSDELTGNYGIIYSAPLSNLLFPFERTAYDDLPEDIKEFVVEENWGKHRYQLEGGATSQNFWYVNPKDGTAETLLWDAGNPYPTEPFTDVNYHIAYYAVGLAVLCAVCIILDKKFRSRWYGELSGRLAIVFGSMAISVVIVTAGQFMELWGEFTEALQDSTAVAVPMTLFGLCVRQLVKLNRQDKGL